MPARVLEALTLPAGCKLLQIFCVRNEKQAEAVRGFRQKHKHQGNKMLGPLNSHFT